MPWTAHSLRLMWGTIVDMLYFGGGGLAGSSRMRFFAVRTDVCIATWPEEALITVAGVE